MTPSSALNALLASTAYLPELAPVHRVSRALTQEIHACLKGAMHIDVVAKDSRERLMQLSKLPMNTLEEMHSARYRLSMLMGEFQEALTQARHTQGTINQILNLHLEEARQIINELTVRMDAETPYGAMVIRYARRLTKAMALLRNKTIVHVNLKVFKAEGACGIDGLKLGIRQLDNRIATATLIADLEQDALDMHDNAAGDLLPSGIMSPAGKSP
ncbi:hypothetical protein VRRI112168_02815 [Vreelandella rituensis]|uniref:Uncharacterized protein n=1 Tax=Vreelandella rituensis TaxID=2282306 RepID=A0A368UAN0_9GAMM|nr:hypothetical protein [Halomonas rituensis]RCV93676.1 hypothetical protein DU506_00535 [Halomonas rituensis]